MNRLTTCFLHVEPNQMICTADQLTGFLGAIVVKGLIKIMFFHKNDSKTPMLDVTAKRYSFLEPGKKALHLKKHRSV